MSFECPVMKWSRVAPEKLALSFGPRRWSYRELAHEVVGWEERLKRRGVRRGDRVAVLSPNRPEVVFLIHALPRIGATLVPLNARLTGHELRPLIERADASLVIADESLIEKAPGAIWFEKLMATSVTEVSSQLGAEGMRGTTVTSATEVGSSTGAEELCGTTLTSATEVSSRAVGLCGTTLTSVTEANGRRSEGDVHCIVARTSATEVAESLGEDDVRCILFTSGTTGVPKGAELTVGNFVANARASAENLGGDPEQVWLGCLPLFHVGGIALVTRAAEYGASVVLQRGFELDGAMRAIFEEGVTHVSLVPTALRRMMETGRRFPGSLRAALIGGGPVSRELVDAARAAGIPAVETYGLTEACSQVATERFPIGTSPFDSAQGMVPLSGTSVRVIDGEVQVRGPTVMRGYFRDPAATSAAIVDGWLRTGDLGELRPNGALVIHSRRTDLIVSGGENVYPAEVEAALMTHPSITDSAVTGIAHPEWGQSVVAVISGSADERSLDAHCRSRLAGFKVPRRFIRVETIPRNANGKVDRIALRNLVQKFL